MKEKKIRCSFLKFILLFKNNSCSLWWNHTQCCINLSVGRHIRASKKIRIYCFSCVHPSFFPSVPQSFLSSVRSSQTNIFVICVSGITDHSQLSIGSHLKLLALITRLLISHLYNTSSMYRLDLWF